MRQAGAIAKWGIVVWVRACNTKSSLIQGSLLAGALSITLRHNRRVKGYEALRTEALHEALREAPRTEALHEALPRVPTIFPIASTRASTL